MQVARNVLRVADYDDGDEDNILIPHYTDHALYFDLQNASGLLASPETCIVVNWTTSGRKCLICNDVEGQLKL